MINSELDSQFDYQLFNLSTIVKAFINSELEKDKEFEVFFNYLPDFELKIYTKPESWGKLMEEGKIISCTTCILYQYTTSTYFCPVSRYFCVVEFQSVIQKGIKNLIKKSEDAIFASSTKSANFYPQLTSCSIYRPYKFFKDKLAKRLKELNINTDAEELSAKEKERFFVEFKTKNPNFFNWYNQKKEKGERK